MKDQAMRDRFWSYVTVFGTVWGALELTLGTFLHVLHVPKTGLIMVTLSLIFLIAQRYIFPVRGSTLCVGVVAACIKSLSPGGIIAGPIFGIISEALIVEICLLAGSRRTFPIILAGSIGVIWSQLQSLFKIWIYYGQGFIDGIEKFVTKFFAVTWTATLGWGLLGVFFVLCILVGGSAALMGRRFGRRVLMRMEETEAQSEHCASELKQADEVGSEHQGSDEKSGGAEIGDTGETEAGALTMISNLAHSGRKKREADEQTIRTRLYILPFAILTFIAQFPDKPIWAVAALAVWLGALFVGARGVLRAIWWPRFWILTIAVCLLSGLMISWTPEGNWDWLLGFEATARMFVRGIYVFSLVSWATRCVRAEEFLTIWKKIHLPELGQSLTKAYSLLPDWLDNLNGMLRNSPKGVKARLKYAHECILDSLCRAVHQAEK